MQQPQQVRGKSRASMLLDNAGGKDRDARLSNDELKEIRNIFALWDVKSAGFIETSELQHQVAQLKLDSNPYLNKSIMLMDRNGRIEARDLIRFFSINPTKDSDKEDHEAIFKMLDLNNTRSISFDEFVKAAEFSGNNIPLDILRAMYTSTGLTLNQSIRYPMFAALLANHEIGDLLPEMDDAIGELFPNKPMSSNK